MKTLYLLRHAKSSWGEKGLDDHDRPLNAKGRETAPRIGAFLRESGHIPKLILSSSAQRTRQTVEAILPLLPEKPAVRFTRALYLAGPEALLAALREQAGPADSVMIVGHNPGLEELARALAREGGSGEERERRARLEEKFPTAALAILGFPAADWGDVAPGTGALEAFVRPKDIAEEGAG